MIAKPVFFHPKRLLYQHLNYDNISTMTTSQRKPKRDIQFALQRMKEAQYYALDLINTELTT